MGFKLFFRFYAVIFVASFFIKGIIWLFAAGFEPLLPREVSVAPSATL